MGWTTGFTMSSTNKGMRVPQATLDHVRLVVSAVGNGAATRSLLEEFTGFSSRHVSYVVLAAQVLDLVAGREHFALTELGILLAETVVGSEDEKAVLRESIQKCPELATLAPDLLTGHPPTASSIRDRIAKETGLSDKTAAHRASMISKWGRLLVGQATLFPMPRAPRSRGMWRRVTLKNYRSIENAVIDLAPFTVVVGPNGSGKSNFADALVFARDVSMNAVRAVESRGGILGVRRWTPRKAADVSIDIKASSTKAGLDKDFVRHCFKIRSGKAGKWRFLHELVEVVHNNSQTATLERGPDGTRLLEREFHELNDDASAMVLASQFREFQRASALTNVRRHRLNPDAMRKPQLSSDSTRLEPDGANIAVALRKVRQEASFDRVLVPMAKIVPGLKDISVESVGRYLSLKFKQQQKKSLADFNATEMSEGALRALGIIVATLQMSRDELLIIEEPEVAIHAGAAEILFDLLKEASRRGAVLVTTHSADLLDAASDESILVCEYSNGTTRIGPLADSQREIVRDGLFSVSELLRSEPLRIQD